MILSVFFVICVSFSKLAGGDELQTPLIKQIHDVINNLSSLALQPDLMKTPECRRDSRSYYEALLQNEMWASEMYDSNARTIPGILKGGNFQMLNVDECLNDISVESKITRKFCIVQIYLESKQKNSISDQLLRKIMKNPIFTSKPYESSLFPANNVFIGGLCVPSSCKISELEDASRKILSIFNESRFQMEVHLNSMKSQQCITRKEYSGETWLTYSIRIFLIASIIFVSLATLLDVCLLQNIECDSQNFVIALLKSYSLKRNAKVLFNSKEVNENLTCINGIRCIAYFLMFGIHYTFRFLVFTVNSSNFYAIMSSPYIAPIWRNFTTILDILIFQSAICHSYKLSKLAMENKRGAILKLFVFRYLRFLIFISAFIFFGASGIIKTKFFLLYTPKKVKFDIWSVIFCYENFFGFQSMFFAPTHTFYTDIQLYATACIVLIAINSMKHKMRIFFSIVLITLLCRSLVLYFRPDTTGFFVMRQSIDEWERMFNVMYATPFGRLPIYLTGIAIGYYIRHDVGKYSNLSSSCIKTGWAIASCCFYLTFWVYSMTSGDYVYNSSDGAIYTFIHTASFLIFATWIVWYCREFKNSGVNKFLSSKTFIILNRLVPYFSILHLLVLVYALADKNGPFEFSWVEIFGFDYMLLTLLVCMFVMLFIHLPMQNFLKYLCGKKEKEIKTS